jgi:CheY-like chemotaxis protein
MGDPLAEPSSDAKHVLVVNDTEEIIELFRDIVEGLGLRISATTFAPEDLAAVKKIGPDLVIMDLLIGGETVGWQLLQKMKMSRETDAIPVIVCTAALDSVREQEGWLTSKGVKIVLKPFNVDDIELAITKALALPEILGGGASA